MRYFYFTRPTIATSLRDAGVSIEQCENIYDPCRIAWRAEITPLLCKVVSDYYLEIGKPIPKPITAYQSMRTKGER